jgi:glycosyltransferase involved in cell wall biosynthesis
MKVLIAGGVFRLPPDVRKMRQPAPEMVLADGLRARGVEVTTVPLEDLSAVARSADSDIVHVHHLSKAAVVSALSPASAPMVFTAHATARPSRRLEVLGEKVVLSRMRAGVCLSEGERLQRVHAKPELEGRLVVIPNGMDLADADPRQRELAPDEVLRGLFVGQLIAVKQIDRIIAAMRDEPRLHVELAYHNDHLLADLRDAAFRSGVLHRMTFLGQLRSAELFDAYRRAHVLLLPSRSEALPSVVTEGLSTGLPVVASSVGGIASQVKDAGILVPPDGVDEVSRVIPQLIDQYADLAARASRRAGELVAEFSVSSMVDRHVDLYHRVLEGTQ